MIKRILIVILALLMVISLAACGEDALYSKKNSTENTSATETVETFKDISEYSKTIEGIEKCLVERGLLKQESVDAKSDMLAELIGAKTGYRYTIDQNVFIEIYEYETASNATADEIKSSITKNGTFSIADMDPLTGVYSSDSKFLLVYNAAIKYDGYEKIAEVIKQF